MRLRFQFIIAFIVAMLIAFVGFALCWPPFYWGFWNLVNRPSDPATIRLVTFAAMAGSLLLMVTLSLLLVGWWLGRRLNRPLQELAAAADRLKERDLDFQIHYAGRDEIGDVCRAFTGMQQALKESLDREWRDQEARREMIAAIAHDLRTPLTLVQGHAESLLAAPPDRRQERLERYLNTIAGGARRASSLLDDLITIQRLEWSDFRLDPTPVALEPILAAWVKEYALLATAQGVNLHYTADGLPPHHAEAAQREVDPALIMADPARLHQVLDNLVANALRYTPAGGQVALSVSWTPTEAHLEVRDTGPGFAAADLPHLFDRYFQGGSGAVGAAGLGLYISRLLVERSGGQITAGNRPEGGSWVAISLPRA